MPGFGTGSWPRSARRSAIMNRNKLDRARNLCAANREKMFSIRPIKCSEPRGRRIAGSAKASASRIVMYGSVSQVGAEESIKGSENHRDKKRQRVIQDSIVEDSA